MSSLTHSRPLRRLATYVVLAFLTACSTAIGPGSAELENKLRVDLPSVWTLADFKVTAEENAGTQTQPDVRSRFVATLALARDVYKSNERLLGKSVLTKTKSAGDMKVELHGIARSRQSGGSWEVKFDFENARNTEPPGKPLSEFSDYVLAGSPEESALREEFAKQVEADRKARVEAERLAQQTAKELDEATGALFKPGARLLSRYSNARTKRSGAFIFVIEKHDPVTRTFSGDIRNDSGESDAFGGSYDGQKVTITQNNRKCSYHLTATGTNPALKGTYSGSPLGGCGQGGTMEIGLQ